MKITQIELTDKHDIHKTIDDIEKLSKNTSAYFIYYRTFSEKEQKIYGVKNVYKVKSVEQVWNIDNDKERIERIALNVMGGHSGLVRIEF